MRRLVALSLVIAASALSLNAQTPTTIFKGRPAVKISEGGTERAPETLGREQAVNLECVVSQIGSDYYWASRENTPLVRIDGGAFTTFIAANGAGYIRIIKPEAKSAAALMGGAEKQYDYVEHALVGLRSVTYYGSRQ
jgi:hypothetical protein